MNYLALTIGPIAETISYCKKTRELWAGSYIFSYFMRSLIRKLIEDVEIDIEFLVPYANKEIANKSFEVGVFHDEFIARSENDKEVLKKVFLSKFSETVAEISSIIYDSQDNEEDEAPSTEDVKIALLEYLQYSYIIASEDELSDINRDNILSPIYDILSSMELQRSFLKKNTSKIYPNPHNNSYIGKINPIAQLQFHAQSLKNIVIKERTEEGEPVSLQFKSVPEIAIANLYEQRVENDTIVKALVTIGEDDNLDAYDAFYKILKDNQFPGFKPHHKYYAVISADVDKMGDFIRDAYKEEPSSITDISKNIYEYITDSSDESQPLVELFEEFGGMLIYAGGDDLLAFAPIFGRGGRTVFELIEEISKRFKKHLGDEVSISFGVSIRYYKSPMIESINHSMEMLQKAKDNNKTDENINTNSGSVALSLQKHSGQSHDAVFLLLDNIYLGYKTLFVCELSRIIELPHSIHYLLINYKKYIIKCFSGVHDGNIDLKIDTLFKNIIEDNTHSKMAKRGLRRLKKYIKTLRPKSVESFDTLISQLAIIKFLRGDK